MKRQKRKWNEMKLKKKKILRRSYIIEIEWNEVKCTEIN